VKETSIKSSTWSSPVCCPEKLKCKRQQNCVNKSMQSLLQLENSLQSTCRENCSQILLPHPGHCFQVRAESTTHLSGYWKVPLTTLFISFHFHLEITCLDIKAKRLGNLLNTCNDFICRFCACEPCVTLFWVLQCHIHQNQRPIFLDVQFQSRLSLSCFFSISTFK
jgi:hypothetical protein